MSLFAEYADKFEKTASRPVPRDINQLVARYRKAADGIEKKAAASEYVPLLGGYIHGAGNPWVGSSRGKTMIGEGTPGFLTGAIGGGAGALGSLAAIPEAGKMAKGRTGLAIAAALLLASLGTRLGSGMGRYFGKPNLNRNLGETEVG